jgi:hypothetical protein
MRPLVAPSTARPSTSAAAETLNAIFEGVSTRTSREHCHDARLEQGLNFAFERLLWCKAYVP